MSLIQRPWGSRRRKPRVMQDDVARLIDALARPAGGSSDFDLVPPFVPPSGQALRPAAVLVPIWLRPSGARVILTKRASHLKHHPGQIAFPAARWKRAMQIWRRRPCARRGRNRPAAVAGGNPGRLSGHETVTSYQMTPF